MSSLTKTEKKDVEQKVVYKASRIMENILVAYRESGEEAAPPQAQLDREIKRQLNRYFQNLIRRCMDSENSGNAEENKTAAKATYAVEYSKNRFSTPKPVLPRSERKGRLPETSWVMRD